MLQPEVTQIGRSLCRHVPVLDRGLRFKFVSLRFLQVANWPGWFLRACFDIDSDLQFQVTCIDLPRWKDLNWESAKPGDLTAFAFTLGSKHVGWADS